MVAYAAVTIDDKDCWLGNSAFLSCVVNIPLLHDAPLRISEDWKWQPQLLAHGFGFCGRVNRDCRDAGARRANFFIVFAVIRQLAEAEGSPVTAKENKRESTV